MRIPLTRYGQPELTIFALVFVTGAVVCARFFPWGVVPFGLCLLGMLWFFRDPQRVGPDGEGLLLSPADGRVLEVTTVPEPEYLQETATRISIFMSLLDVHVNRMPCACRVAMVQHRPGKFHVASKPEASDRNEHVLIGLALLDKEGKKNPHPSARMLLKQVAGVLARRIVCACRPGDELARGQRFGMIKFGSRVEIYLPKSFPHVISVLPGDKVYAGRTIIGRIG